MLQSAKYSNHIIEKINQFKSEIRIKSNNNLNDESVYAENFVCELLNLCYDYKLHNLNEEKSNFPGIDLGDEANKLGIQVTMQSTSEKVNKTLEKCYTNKCYTKFPNLKFFMLSDKQKSYSIKKSYKEINFDYKEDILDFNDLYKTIINLGIDKQEEIFKYINKQFPEDNPNQYNSGNQEEIASLLEQIRLAQKSNDNGILLNKLLEDSLRKIEKNINDEHILKASNFITKIFTCGISGIQKDSLIKLYYYKGIINLKMNNDEEMNICISKIESIDDKSGLLNKLKIKSVMYRNSGNTFESFLKQISKYLTEEIDLRQLEIEYLVVKQKYQEVIEKYGELVIDDENMNYVLAIAYLNYNMFEESIACIKKSIKKNNSIKYKLVYEQAMALKEIYNIRRTSYMTKEQNDTLEACYKRLEDVKLEIIDISTNFRISYYSTILNILIFIDNSSFKEVYLNIPYDLKDKYEIRNLLALSYSQSGEMLKAAEIYEELYKKNQQEYDLMAMFQTLLNGKQYDSIIVKFNELEKEQYDNEGVIVSSYLSALRCKGEDIDKYVDEYDSIYRDKPYYNIININLYNNDIDMKKKYFDFLKNTLKNNSIFFTYQAIQIAKEMGWIEDEIEILEKSQFEFDELKEILIELYINVNDKESLEKAQKLVDDQLKKGSNNFKLYSLKAEIEFGLTNWKQSLRYYKLAFEISKNEFIACNIVNLMMQNNIKEGLEEYCTYIISKTKRSDMLMIVAIAYNFLGNSRTADELAFQSLYLAGNKVNEDLMQQYIWMQMTRIQHSVSDNIKTFDCIDKDCMCILCNKINNEVINLCINSQRCYESYDMKIFNAKHISMENEIAIELIGAKIDDEVELDGEQYIVKELMDKYIYLFRYITQLYTDSYPKSKFLTIIDTTDTEKMLNDIRNYSDQFYKGKNIIESYKFDEGNFGIPLDILTRGESNQYINVVDWLLNNEKQVLYSGERNNNLNLKLYDTVILTLSSIVILYKLNKLYLLNEIKSKIIIPTSLKEEIFNCYKNSVIMKKRGGGRLVFLDDSDKTPLFLDNKSNTIDRQWKNIYEYVKTLRTEDINEFELDSTSDKLYSICNIFEAESIILCKKYNGVLLCDDLFLRRVSNIINVDNTNILSLINVNSDEENIKLVNDLANKSYYCPSLPLEIIQIKASNEEKKNVIQGLMNNETKQKIYGPIIKYVYEAINNIKIGFDIKGDKIYLTIDKK